MCPLLLKIAKAPTVKIVYFMVHEQGELVLSEVNSRSTNDRWEKNQFPLNHSKVNFFYYQMIQNATISDIFRVFALGGIIDLRCIGI